MVSTLLNTITQYNCIKILYKLSTNIKINAFSTQPIYIYVVVVLVLVMFNLLTYNNPEEILKKTRTVSTLKLY